MHHKDINKVNCWWRKCWPQVQLRCTHCSCSWSWLDPHLQGWTRDKCAWSELKFRSHDADNWAGLALLWAGLVWHDLAQLAWLRLRLGWLERPPPNRRQIMHESSALVIAADEQLVDDCYALRESEREREEPQLLKGPSLMDIHHRLCSIDRTIAAAAAAAVLAS